MGSLPQLSKDSSVAEVQAFLSGYTNLKPETLDCLRCNDIDGDMLLSFTDKILIENFSKDINYAQRQALMKIIEKFGNPAPPPADNLTTEEGASVTSIVVTDDSDDLGVRELGGYIDDNGILCCNSTNEAIMFDIHPCISSSIIKKRKKRESDVASKSKASKVDAYSVEPMDVLGILNDTEAGKKVRNFIKEKGGLDVSHQTSLLNILFRHVTVGRESPLKYYPESQVKISMAKGITKDFPELADEGDCPWASWLRIVKTKFETVQSKLPPEKKKNSKRVSSDKSSKAKGKAGPSSAGAKITTSDSQIEPDDITNSKKSWMRDAVPTSRNKDEISRALHATYQGRRNWILNERPTCTDILEEYPHLASYEGEMISEEFSRIEPLEVDIVPRFKKIANYIVKHCSLVKPDMFTEVNALFDIEELQALVLLPKLLTLTLNSKTAPQDHLEHFKLFKESIQKFPSSALLQIVPEGTDVESYDSVETRKDIPSPMFPFLLWTTKDRLSGKMYLKIDKKTFLVGSVDNVNAGEIVIKAIALAMKAHFVFNLAYHPYMRAVFNYFECLAGINQNPLVTVSKLNAAVRALVQK
ncbi:uncharacterized protein LOC117642445 [Thrips palmi]|uniref:Uncharacterized protein LOC117642445 n=1 Tax=Thrips palmi TaxID=161013 RepID=A0A6P8YAB1_THRPL|nr:uncharacterized protein LOC117642445 [Thrips palmi]